MDSPRWLPLESNPEVMTKFVNCLGMRPTWQFGDVYGLDPELLGMVPRPVCAVLLLFPVTDKYEAFKQEEEEKLKGQQQEVSPDVYFIKQTIGNACGTIGLIHAVANNQAHLEFESDSPLKKFIEQTSKMTAAERAAFLEKDESIRVTHESSAQEGQTEAPSLDEKVNLHFIAFVNVGGQLYELGESTTVPSKICSRSCLIVDDNDLNKLFKFICMNLDGRKPFPIVHGKTSEDRFLEVRLHPKTGKVFYKLSC
uniref:Ubiquitin carboxyl-terminal hydrolase n=1 Tax=Gasterosteus aculeatus aculeatus TaxID=481459 RepID=A0AAQ4QIP7_GASAC